MFEPSHAPAARKHILPALLLASLLTACGGPPPPPAPVTASLVVTTTNPARQPLSRAITVSGSVAAWQEMSLGVELTGIRVAEVLVEVGDAVRSGQPLLRLDSRTLQVQARQADAGVAQAKASLELARANAERGTSLVRDGLISSSDADELRTTLTNAEAQLATALADQEAARLRLGYTTLTAPDSGVISARSVQPGQIVTSGTDLLRLIRQGRLEWRAELTAEDLTKVSPGTTVELTAPSGQKVEGQVRTVSPALDPTTRTGILYADLPEPGDLRAGMFAQGQILLGNATATVLPRESVIYRDGIPYVFVAESFQQPEGSAESEPLLQVKQRRIVAGSQRGDLVDVRDGVELTEKVVVSGAGFLSDGDLVREVAASGAAVAGSPP